MIRNNKGKTVISSILILLPILVGLLLWDVLPNNMVTHWGADGNPDGIQAKAFAVFLTPCIFLAIHLLCLGITGLDRKQKDQNKKALNLVFWILPVISCFASGMIYAIALGKEYSYELFVPILLGCLFLFVGNYMPKVKQNRTLGIRLSWTLQNEENWNLTHRFGGKVWVIGGLILLFSVFTPVSVMVGIMVADILAMVILPFAYSYRIYRRHQKEGIVYTNAEDKKTEKWKVILTSVVVCAILAATAALMFTGDVDVEIRETSMEIKTIYWNNVTIDYEDLDSIRYVDDFQQGIRTNGFASAKLSLGMFKHEVLGDYTCYCYTACDDAIILQSGDEILVLNGKTEKETVELYNQLLLRTGLLSLS